MRDKFLTLTCGSLLLLLVILVRLATPSNNSAAPSNDEASMADRTDTSPANTIGKSRNIPPTRRSVPMASP